MNNKNRTTIIVTVLLVAAVSLFFVTNSHSSSAKTSTMTSTQSSSQLGTSQANHQKVITKSFGDIAKSNKLTLLYSIETEDNSPITKSLPVTVIAVKGRKAALYTGLQVSDVIGKSDSQVLTAAKAADEKEYKKSQDTARANLHVDDEGVQKLNKKLLGTDYAAPKFMSYTVTGEKGDNNILSSENVHLSYSNEWNDSDSDKNDPSQPALLTMDFTIDDGMSNIKTTVGGQKFVGISTGGANPSVVTKSDTLNLQYILDKPNDPIISSIS